MQDNLNHFKINPLTDVKNHQLCLKIENYYSQTYQQQFQMKKHLHDRIEIMYVVSGSCIIDVIFEGELKQYTLYGSEFILIDSGISHSLAIHDDEVTRVLNVEMSLQSARNFSGTSIQKLKDTIESFRCYIDNFNGVSKLIDDGYVQKIIAAIHRESEMNSSQSETDYLVDMYMQQLFIEISRCASSKLRVRTSYTYVKKALNYIDLNFCNEISLECMAREIEIHVIYLHRIFKQNIGMTIIEYINSLRIKRACIIIENTNRPLNEIYSEVGFHNRQHFTHTFKNIVGITPSEYKRKSLDKNYVHTNQDPSTNLVQQD
ncbi:MAG: AraC family transcriptional regulator [Saccharofermentanales bacterium]